MSAPTERSADRGLLDVLDGLVYSDLFDCAVTEEEIWRFSRRAIEPAELRAILEDRDGAIAGLLSNADGLWCLRGRERLLSERPSGRRRARRLQGRAVRVASVLGRVPFVRGLLLTGSAAADDAEPGADLDLMVLVEPGRIATVFAILGTASRLLGRELFCPNHYLATDALELDQRDIYAARELAQSRPLGGRAVELIGANRWVGELLPNAGAVPTPPALPRQGRLQRLLERPLAGRLGDRLEAALKRLGRRRLYAHHRERGGSPPPAALADLESGRQLRFHAGTDASLLLERYERSRRELARALPA